MYRSLVYSLLTYDKYMHPCNQHLNKNIEHHHYPKKSPHIPF